MKSKGKLIFIAGYSGAGKSTLARATLNAFPQTQYLKTYTTRPPRTSEAGGSSFEYEFVDQPSYDKLRQKHEWDHLDYQGYAYGADIAESRRLLAEEYSLVCCMVPNLRILKQQEAIFAMKPVLIWVDTPLEVANGRLAVDPERSARIENPLQNEAAGNAVRDYAEYVFTPKSAVAETTADFIELLRPLI